MSQASVSRAKAVRALKNNQNDIVNAIMVRAAACCFITVVVHFYGRCPAYLTATVQLLNAN